MELVIFYFCEPCSAVFTGFPSVRMSNAGTLRFFEVISVALLTGFAQFNTERQALSIVTSDFVSVCGA